MSRSYRMVSPVKVMKTGTGVPKSKGGMPKGQKPPTAGKGAIRQRKRIAGAG